MGAARRGWAGGCAVALAVSALAARADAQPASVPADQTGPVAPPPAPRPGPQAPAPPAPPPANRDAHALPEPTTAEPTTARSLRAIGDAVAARTAISGFGQVEYLRREISTDQLADGSGEPLNEDRFQVRHARLRLDTAWRYLGVSSEAELFADGGTARPVAYELTARWPARDRRARPWIEARAGLFPVPFGYENYDQSDAARFFGERTLMMSGFAPGRFDLGASLGGNLGAIAWVVAVQNGQPLGDDAFATRDPNAAKDLAGRVRIEGQLVAGLHVAAGVSALSGTGFSPGTPPSKDTFEWRDLNEDGRVAPSELIPIPGSAGRASQNFERWGLAGDVQLWTELPRLGKLLVYGELALAVNLDRGVAPADPVLLGRDQRSAGFYVAAVQKLGEHAAAGARFEQYEPNIDSLELFDGTTVVTRRRFRTLSAGVSAEWPLEDDASARILAEYELQRNSLGRDNQGRPAQLDNDTIRIRAQVVF